jgi:hypothetical protein
LKRKKKVVSYQLSVVRNTMFKTEGIKGIKNAELNAAKRRKLITDH